MRTISKLGAALAILVATSSVFAEGSNNLNKGKFGLSVSTSSNTMIAGKYLVTDRIGVIAGLGLLNNSSKTDAYLMGGARIYFPKDIKSALVPFAGGRAWYSSVNSANTSSYGLAAEAGAEYFFDKQFSLEGLVSFGYSSTSPSVGASYSSFGTSMYALGANFYY